MKKPSNRRIATLASSAALLTLSGACSDQLQQPSSDFNNEQVQAFINRYGVPDPNHDWSLATTAGLKIKADNPVNLRVYAEIDGQRYIFADLTAYQGSDPLPILVPKNVSRLILEVNGSQYICGVDDSVDIDALVASPQSRDYLSYDRTDPAGDDTRGHFRVEYKEDGNIDGRVLKYDIAKNPELLKIIETPYKSEYILCEEYKDENGETVQDPLWPSLESIHLARKHGVEEFADYEFMPVYVRSRTPENTEAEYTFSVHPTPTYIGGVWYDENRYNLDIDHDAYNIGYVDDNDRIVNVTNPTTDHSKWVGKTIKVVANGQNIPYGMDYIIQKTTGGGYAGTERSLNSGGTWDTEIGGPTTAYSSCLYFDHVPFTYSENGQDVTEEVFVYAIFAAPTEIAQTRPNQADFFIIEFYDPEKLDHRRWYPGSSSSYSFRLMAEDLGETDDWDYNDLVVDVSVVYKNRNIIISNTSDDHYGDRYLMNRLGSKFVKHITITPAAAGGIMPIYLGYRGSLYTSDGDISALKGYKVSEVMKMSDEELEQYKPKPINGNFQIHKEMHNWLGESSTDQMINTKILDHTGEKIEFDVETFSESDLYIIVDKDNELVAMPLDGTNCSFINDSDEKYQTNYSAKADPADSETDRLIPRIMFLNSNFPWARERKDFGAAYPDFHKWVQNAGFGLDWYSTRDKSLTIEKEIP